MHPLDLIVEKYESRDKITERSKGLYDPIKYYYVAMGYRPYFCNANNKMLSLLLVLREVY